MTDKPNPGSTEAYSQGCTCAVLDNAHGRGAYEIDGVPQFWHDAACPVHGVLAFLLASEPEEVGDDDRAEQARS